MLAPVILPESILNHARLWQEECWRRWAEAVDFPRIGEATFVLPWEPKERKVVLHLGSGFSVKGKIFPGIRSVIGEVIGEGYTVVLNRLLIERRDRMIPILLHELTHAVDPYFDQDIRRQEEEGHLTQPLDLYGLPSEQRAFSAMWTEDLREELAQGQFRSPDASVLLYRRRSPEFDGFLKFRPDLLEQTKEHFWRIVEDLRRRIA
jgi:hypothetical protein